MDDGGLGRTQHFVRICKEIWPKFEWNEWAHEMAEVLCENDITGFTSGASSGKSEILAKFVLVSWFADPVNTLCIVCSTTALDARQKIWGHIVRNFREARSYNKSVGCLVESMNIIRLTEKTDGLAASDNSSICLVAAGDSYKDDSLKRLQGRHQKNVMLALDELQDCSLEIITTAIGNLSANEHVEVHAAGNASSRSDAHGLFLTPVEGWSCVNRFTHKWKIRCAGKIGIGVHFDCTRDDSPNMKRFADGMPQLTFLRKADEIVSGKETYGEDNPTYMRQFVGYWREKDQETNYIVTDAALAVHEAYDKAVWKSGFVSIAGIDPSYSQGGDQFILFHLRYGLSVFEVWIVEFFESIPIRVKPIKGEEKDHAAIRQCMGICSELNIGPRNVGIDSSAGNPILSIAHKEWSPEILGVQFGGNASELPISQFDKRIARDLYANRTSELAYVFVEFLNAGQVRGIRPEHAKQLTARQFSYAAGGKIKIESKVDFKKRCGYSPDIADAGHIGLAVLRERLHAKAGEHSQQARAGSGDWKALAAKRSVSTRTDSPASGQKSIQQQALEHVEANRQGLMRLAKMLHKP